MLNRGVSRKSRANNMLNPEYISLDERSLLDLVLFTIDYASRLNYYSSTNKVEGNWKSFFLTDPSFVMAIMAGSNLVKYKKDQDAFFNLDSKVSDLEKIQKLLASIFEMAETTLYWFELLTDSNYKGVLLKETEHLKTSLIKDITSSKHGIHFLNQSKKLDPSLDKKFRAVCEMLELEEISLGVDKDFLALSAQDYLIFLNDIFHMIYGKMIFLKESATKEFETSVDEIDDHLPHIGLLLTFFKLFKYVQEDINAFTKDHLDFYYTEVLEEKFEKHQKGDIETMLQIELKKGVDSLILDADSSFDFAIENGESSQFKNTKSTQINRALLTDIKSIYNHHHKPFHNKNEIEGIHLNLLYQTDVLKRIDANKAGTQQDSDEFPYVFGQEGDQMCELGFVLSSPALIIEKGEHHVEITLKFEEDSFKNMLALFDELDSAEYQSANNQSEVPKNDSIYRKFFRNAFKIYISDADGWNLLPFYEVSVYEELSKLKLGLHLNRIEDQMINFDPEIHEGNFESKWPCIKVLLNSYATYHPYVFLKNLTLEFVKIKAVVKQVNALKLANNNGNIDPSIPFTPFGSIPEKGSYLKIQNPKIFQRNLSDLKFSVQWSGLPQNRTGFKGYYEEYQCGVDNDDFVAVISDHRDLKRGDNNGQQEFRLFGSDGEGYLNNHRDEEVLLNNLNFNKPIIESEVKDRVDSPSLFLILKEPVIGFGHRVFPELYAQAAMQKRGFRRKPKPLPKQPYTPVMDRLSIDYSNVAKEHVLRKQDDKTTDIKLIHMYPFGHVTVFPGSIKEQCYLLPQISSKGNLYLGLNQVNPGEELNLGFDLIPSVYKHSIISVPKVRWSYLEHNEWKDFGDGILEDATDGLISSGIVKIKIPNSIYLDNTRLPHGIFWLKVAYEAKEDLNSRIKNICTQAILLRSKKKLANSIWNEKKMMKASVKPINEKKIQKVSRPMAITGFKKSTEENEFYTRVSERLRHKNRAVTNWDMERIIMDKFPQVKKVRVYGRNNAPKELTLGCTTQIVVIPNNNSVEETFTQGNMFDIATLKQIRSYARQFVSPYVCVEVCNPVYEQLKVRCRIEFKDSLKSQYYSQKLNEELVGFLSPDIESDEGNRLFDDSISKTEIFNFIDQKKYVKNVKEFSVIQLVEVNGKHKIIDTEKEKNGKKIELLRTISAYAILTSAPRHHIEIMLPSLYEVGPIKGIGDISIGSDFVIVDKNGNYTDD